MAVLAVLVVLVVLISLFIDKFSGLLVVLELYWCCIGVVLVLYWLYWLVLALHWPCIGLVLALYWPCIGLVLALYWLYCPCIGAWRERYRAGQSPRASRGGWIGWILLY